jgi:pentatricopeptide repeat protein
MDSSLEGFFYKRTFNLENINFLFQILAEKGDLIEAQALLTKMDQLAISPDNVSYNLLIKTSGKAYNMQTAEHYFSLSVQAFGHDVHIYNSLMYGYARQRNGSMVEKLFQDLKLKGLSPNLPIYTTLINALYKEHSSPSSQGQNILSL